VAGVLADKKWFSDIVDAESLNRQLSANEELRKAMIDYLSKLRTVNFSDPELSKVIGKLTNVDAFLLVSVDTWNYTVEKGDKVAKVSLGMKLYEASTGKIMWKSGHQIADSYMLIKPGLPKVAREVVSEMVGYMPR
jgi:PBP1b-binding outer membrane lipoprotein LpoB